MIDENINEKVKNGLKIHQLICSNDSVTSAEFGGENNNVFRLVSVDPI